MSDNTNLKTSKNQTFINIPNFEPIPIGAGTVSVSGATVSAQVLGRELRKAAKDNIVPLPQETSGQTSHN